MNQRETEFCNRMEPRVCSKEFISNAKFILRTLSRIRRDYDGYIRCCSTLSEKDYDKYSTQTSKQNDKSHKSPSTRILIKRNRKYLQYLLGEDKLKSKEVTTDEKRKEVKRFLSALTEKTKGSNYSMFKNKRRVIISSLMYKTYMGLKDKDLVCSNLPSTGLDIFHQNVPEKLELEEDFLTKAANSQWLSSSIICNSNRHESESDSLLKRNYGRDDEVPLSKSETFKRMLHEKYKEPPEPSVERLKSLFPEPENLFHAVMRPAWDIGLYCHEPLTVSSHMRGFYWKAKIQLMWPRKVTVTGVYTDKQNAMMRAYLAACKQLMDLGLLVKCGDDPFQPMTCDTVVSMLEQVSEYGDSTITTSRGKGFKIVLEKTRKLPDHHYHHQKEEAGAAGKRPWCYNHLGGKVCCDWNTGNHDQRDSADGINGTKEANGRSTRWSCCVHVGWPVPFSVGMVAPSLPSAQRMALLTAASNLKLIGLLTKTNSEVNPVALQHAVLRETSSQWERCVQSAKDTNQLRQFEHGTSGATSHAADVDATIFVDASMVGYGAYLSFKDSEKVSWLCESWPHQPQFYSVLFGHSTGHLDHQQRQRHRFYLNSTVAELFALVSTIFSWKRKLQHCRLVCYSDNQTAVTMISALKSTQLSNTDRCINVYDYLIKTLHETCQTYNIHLHTAWIQRDRNWLADRLANGDVQVFKAAVPNAVARKTKVKHLQLKDNFQCGD